MNSTTNILGVVLLLSWALFQNQAFGEYRNGHGRYGSLSTWPRALVESVRAQENPQKQYLYCDTSLFIHGLHEEIAGREFTLSVHTELDARNYTLVRGIRAQGPFYEQVIRQLNNTPVGGVAVIILESSNANWVMYPRSHSDFTWQDAARGKAIIYASIFSDRVAREVATGSVETQLPRNLGHILFLETPRHIDTQSRDMRRLIGQAQVSIFGSLANTDSIDRGSIHVWGAPLEHLARLMTVFPEIDSLHPTGRFNLVIEGKDAYRTYDTAFRASFALGETRLGNLVLNTRLANGVEMSMADYANIAINQPFRNEIDMKAVAEVFAGEVERSARERITLQESQRGPVGPSSSTVYFLTSGSNWGADPRAFLDPEILELRRLSQQIRAANVRMIQLRAQAIARATPQ